MEFINEPPLRWCLEWYIEPTQSRPYHKNASYYAGQKNFDAVRKTVGYFRFDTSAEYAALVEVYRYLCPLYNYWYTALVMAMTVFAICRQRRKRRVKYSHSGEMELMDSWITRRIRDVPR
jgi:hypothetical protein